MAARDDYDPDQPPPAEAGLFGLPFTPDDAELVIVPVPWDATTSYRAGTSRGPDAVRAASHQLDLFDLDLGEPWKAGISMLPMPAEIADLNARTRTDAEKIIEVGGRIAGNAELEKALSRVNDASARVNRHVYETVDRLLKQGKRVGLLGGDHSVPFGAIKRHAEEHEELAVLHIDAHADLRDSYEGFEWSHASIMHNVVQKLPGVKKLVQVGIRDFSKGEADFIARSNGRVVTHFDQKLAERKAEGETWGKICDDVIESLPNWVYVSFDIDGLDPSFCPHTGTPVPGGLSFNEAAILVKRVVESGVTIVGFDLNEVAPGADGDEWDANVGARMLYKLCGWMLKSWE